jgi:alkylation response protein AidB-like acyl-CoA dehydrogenase
MSMPRTLFDDDHKLFRESAAAFVDREILPRREEIREQRRIPKELWRTAGEAGFLGVAVPEAYGGSDVDFRYNAIFNEELSRAGMAYS